MAAVMVCHVTGRGRVVGGLRDGAVLDLERLQGGGGGLEPQPLRVSRR